MYRMLKRNVLTSLCLIMALSSCATISVVPGVTGETVSLTQRQTSLRLAAANFNDMAAARGWISQSNGLIDLAGILVDGRSDEIKTTYADLIGADIRLQEEVSATLIADARDAATALAGVSIEAEAFIKNRRADTYTMRDDLMSFERALVQAQQTRRTFMEAFGIAKLNRTPRIQLTFDRFDSEIDRARALADQLAAEYAQRDRAESVS